MPTFSVNMRHTVESCAMFNLDVKKKFKEVIGKRDEAAKKHGIKIKCMDFHTGSLNLLHS